MHTNLCSTAVQLLQNHLDQPDENGHLETLIHHSASCQACSFDSSYLLEALRAEAVDNITCQACEERLPEFVLAESEGVEAVHSWLTVTLHLKTCPHCAAEYEALRELVALSTDDVSSAPVRYPAPDLSFLKQRGISLPQVSGGFWYLNELGRLVINFSTELLAALELRPLALQGLKSGESRLLYEFTVSEAFEDCDVRVAAEADRLDPALCTMIVTVTNPDREWPQLGGSQVTLHRRDEASVTQETDPYGEAVFHQIAASALPHLIIEVKPSA